MEPTRNNGHFSDVPGGRAALCDSGFPKLLQVKVFLLAKLAVDDFSHCQVQMMCRRWLSRRGSTMAAIATAAAAELRKANPNLYPPAPHCWYRLAGDQLHAPMLCVVCQNRFQPEQDVRPFAPFQIPDICPHLKHFALSAGLFCSF